MLRITRAADTVLYGGYNLDPENLEATADHTFWVRKVSELRHGGSAMIHTRTKTGVSDRVVLINDDLPFTLDNEIRINLMDIHMDVKEAKPYCEVCGRGSGSKKKMVPQAKLGLEAPRSYSWTRDDATRRKSK